MKILPLLSLGLVLTACASDSSKTSLTENVTILREVKTEEVTYNAAGATLTGYFAYPSTATAQKRVPGILVVHEWWGHNEYARHRARRLAELGYAAFALDMYGDGKLAEHPTDAQAFAQEATGDEDRMTARFDAALAQLHSKNFVDPNQTGAIGYCMGGGIVLNMVRLGKDLDAVASFHGSLPTGRPYSPRDSDDRIRVLVCTGGADDFVPADTVATFEKEFIEGMDRGELRTVVYPGVKHSFTNPKATAVGEKFGLPLAYDVRADSDSWEQMRVLFRDAFRD